MTDFWHPFADMAQVEAARRAHARARRGRLRLRRRRPALPRCHRLALVLQRGLGPGRDRRGRGRARCASSPPTRRSVTSRTAPAEALATRVAAHGAGGRVRRCSSPAVAPTRSTPPRRWRVATGSSAMSRERDDLDPAREGLPRHAHRRDLARRHPRERDRSRRADRRRHRGGVERRRRPPRGDRARRPRAGRGVLLRTGDRRRRRVPSPAGLPRGRTRGVSRHRTCCSSPTRSSPGSGEPATGSPRTASASIPTSSRAPRASPAATCRWAR